MHICTTTRPKKDNTRCGMKKTVLIKPFNVSQFSNIINNTKTALRVNFIYDSVVSLKYSTIVYSVVLRRNIISVVVYGPLANWFFLQFNQVRIFFYARNYLFVRNIKIRIVGLVYYFRRDSVKNSTWIQVPTSIHTETYRQTKAIFITSCRETSLALLDLLITYFLSQLLYEYD